MPCSIVWQNDKIEVYKSYRCNFLNTSNLKLVGFTNTDSSFTTIHYRFSAWTVKLKMKCISELTLIWAMDSRKKEGLDIVFFQTNIQYLKTISVILCVHEYLVRGWRYWVMLACGFIYVHIQLYDFRSCFPLFGESASIIFFISLVCLGYAYMRGHTCRD